jgi:hypothetical protein
MGTHHVNLDGNLRKKKIDPAGKVLEEIRVAHEKDPN